MMHQLGHIASPNANELITLQFSFPPNITVP